MFRSTKYIIIIVYLLLLSAQNIFGDSKFRYEYPIERALDKMYNISRF